MEVLTPDAEIALWRRMAGERGRLYRALAEAGSAGVVATALQEQGITSIGVHIESLRFEGHHIRIVILPKVRYVLEKDAWATTPSPARPVAW